MNLIDLGTISVFFVALVKTEF